MMKLVGLITSYINEIVEDRTKNFNNWQIQDSVVGKIRVDIIKKLVDLSKTHS